MSDKNQNIDDLIRDGFSSSEDNFDFGSWSQVEKKLDADAGLDEQIQNAFSFAPTEVPTSAWDSISEDLDIDTVWKRVDKALSQRKRRRVIWWNAAAIAALLILSGYVFRDYIGDAFVQNSNLTSQLNTNDFLTPEANESRSTSEFFPSNNGNFIGTEPAINEELNNSGFETGSDVSPLNVNEGENQNLITQDRNPGNALDNVQREFQTFSKIPVGEIQLLNIESERVNAPNVKIEPKQEVKPQKSWTIGTLLGVNNSFIADATWREGLSTNSLASNNFSMSLSPGLFVQRKLSNGLMIGSEFYFNSKSVRSTKNYEHFELVNQAIELNYYKMALNVNKVLAFKNKPDFYGIIGAGVYGSYLKYGLEYRDMTIIGYTDEYKNFDYGLEFNLGAQKSFGNINLGTGLRSSIGLSNIFTGTEQQSSDLNLSKVITNGFYLSLGYQF